MNTFSILALSGFEVALLLPLLFASHVLLFFFGMGFGKSKRLSSKFANVISIFEIEEERQSSRPYTRRRSESQRSLRPSHPERVRAHRKTLTFWAVINERLFERYQSKIDRCTQLDEEIAQKVEKIESINSSHDDLANRTKHAEDQLAGLLRNMFEDHRGALRPQYYSQASTFNIRPASLESLIIEFESNLLRVDSTQSLNLLLANGIEKARQAAEIDQSRREFASALLNTFDENSSLLVPSISRDGFKSQVKKYLDAEQSVEGLARVACQLNDKQLEMAAKEYNERLRPRLLQKGFELHGLLRKYFEKHQDRLAPYFTEVDLVAAYEDEVKVARSLEGMVAAYLSVEARMKSILDDQEKKRARADMTGWLEDLGDLIRKKEVELAAIGENDSRPLALQERIAVDLRDELTEFRALFITLKTEIGRENDNQFLIDESQKILVESQ